jgi:hypothetical protein
MAVSYTYADHFRGGLVESSEKFEGIGFTDAFESGGKKGEAKWLYNADPIITKSVPGFRGCTWYQGPWNTHKPPQGYSRLEHTTQGP